MVAYLRGWQAENLNCHSMAPTLAAAERSESRQTVLSVLLPQCLSTVMRRKAAGTLLPGSCRPAEVAWWRANKERALLQQGQPAEVARIGAEAFGPMLGSEVYFFVANVAFDVLTFARLLGMSREMQQSHAAFVVSAFELMAQPHGRTVSVVVDGVTKAVFTSASERSLAQNVSRSLLHANISSLLDGEVMVLIADAWQRVVRSGAAAMRQMGTPPDPSEFVSAAFDAAAAEGAVRGLHECALASCTSKEVHVSQFKKCGACRIVAYCCREHQLADWPSHKAACKAARKQAA